MVSAELVSDFGIEESGGGSSDGTHINSRSVCTCMLPDVESAQEMLLQRTNAS